MSVLYEQIDDDASAWEAFVCAWFEVFQDRPVTAAEIKVEVEREGSRLRDALPPELGTALEGKRFTQSLGYALRARVDQVIGELRLERPAKDEHAKVARWRVMRVTAGNVSPDATRAHARARGNGTRPEDHPPSPASPAGTPAREREVFEP